MNESSPPLLALTPAKREAVIQKWLAQVLESYPEQTSRFLLNNRDPFRNPVGRALTEGLPVLVDEVCGAFDTAKVSPVLDEIVHIRAVQDFSAGQAVSFLFLLKSILRSEFAPQPQVMSELEVRLERLSLLAFDLYMKCREKTWELRVNEAKRRVYVLERVASRGR